MLIRDIPSSDSIILVTDSQDVQHIKDHLNAAMSHIPDFASDFDSFFVEFLDRDYGRIWGFFGIVPHLDRLCYLVQS